MPSTVRSTPSLRRQAGEALAAERPAVADAQRDAQVDGRLLALDLAVALGGVGVREVGREAEQRRDLLRSPPARGATGARRASSKPRKKPS